MQEQAAYMTMLMVDRSSKGIHVAYLSENGDWSSTRSHWIYIERERVTATPISWSGHACGYDVSVQSFKDGGIA